MNTINPYTQSIVTPNNNTTYNGKDKETVELTRSEVINSKDLTTEQKLEKLGIKPMTAEEMANGLADKIIDGEV